jgi:hypothetical protein
MSLWYARRRTICAVVGLTVTVGHACNRVLSYSAVLSQEIMFYNSKVMEILQSTKSLCVCSTAHVWLKQIWPSEWRVGFLISGLTLRRKQISPLTVTGLSLCPSLSSSSHLLCVRFTASLKSNYVQLEPDRTKQKITVFTHTHKTQLHFSPLYI